MIHCRVYAHSSGGMSACSCMSMLRFPASINAPRSISCLAEPVQGLRSPACRRERSSPCGGTLAAHLSHARSTRGLGKARPHRYLDSKVIDDFSDGDEPNDAPNKADGAAEIEALHGRASHLRAPESVRGRWISSSIAFAYLAGIFIFRVERVHHNPGEKDSDVHDRNRTVRTHSSAAGVLAIADAPRCRVRSRWLRNHQCHRISSLRFRSV